MKKISRHAETTIVIIVISRIRTIKIKATEIIIILVASLFPNPRLSTQSLLERRLPEAREWEADSDALANSRGLVLKSSPTVALGPQGSNASASIPEILRRGL